MTTIAKSTFTYVTYIRTTPETLWQALTTPEFTKKYWFGAELQADWSPGAPWKLVFDDGSLADSGRVLEYDPHRRIALSWRNEWSPEINAEGYGTCTMELEPVDDSVKLTIMHEIEREDSQLIGRVSGGWPRILSNLKTLLESGKPLF